MKQIIFSIIFSNVVVFEFLIFLVNLTLLGDRLRADLRKKDIQPSKMALLEQKFDEVKRDGLLMPSAQNTDEPDIPQSIVKQTRLVKRTPSSNVRKPLTLDVTPGKIIFY